MKRFQLLQLARYAVSIHTKHDELLTVTHRHCAQEKIMYMQRINLLRRDIGSFSIAVLVPFFQT